MAYISIYSTSQTLIGLSIKSISYSPSQVSELFVKRYSSYTAASSGTTSDSAPKLNLSYFTAPNSSIGYFGQLTCGTTYYFKGWYKVGSLYYPVSVTSASTSACTPTYTVLTAPLNPRITVIGTTTATFRWDQSTQTYAGGYTVRYKKSSSSIYTYITGFSNSQTNINIVGLTPNTQYDFGVKVHHTVSSTYDSVYRSTWSTTSPIAYTQLYPPSGLYVYSEALTSITLRWSQSTASYAGSYRIQYRRVGTTTWAVTSTSIANSTTIYTISNLLSGTTYEFQIKVYHTISSTYDSDYSSSVYGTTLTAPPSALTGLYVTNITATTATAYWNSSSGATSYTVLLKRGTTTIVNTSTTSTSRSFSGLLSNSLHTLTVTPTNSGGSGTSQTVSFTTLIGYTKPADWIWTTTELNAINNNGAFSTITATRWNSFLDRVEDFINYFNAVNGTGVYSVTSGTSNPMQGDRNCKVSVSPPGVLTANDFNHIRNSIGSMNSTGLSLVYAGQPVYGSYIITITNSLNGI